MDNKWNLDNNLCDSNYFPIVHKVNNLFMMKDLPIGKKIK